MNRYALTAFLLLVAACSKKDATSQPAPAPSASAPTGAAADTPPAEPSPVPDPVRAASTSATPAEPNAPPPHDEHERAAATEVHKGNYKNQLEALEKEDLSGDRR